MLKIAYLVTQGGQSAAGLKGFTPAVGKVENIVVSELVESHSDYQRNIELAWRADLSPFEQLQESGIGCVVVVDHERRIHIEEAQRLHRTWSEGVVYRVAVGADDGEVVGDLDAVLDLVIGLVTDFVTRRESHGIERGWCPGVGLQHPP